MSEQQNEEIKDIEYYKEHLDEFPDDPSTLFADEDDGHNGNEDEGNADTANVDKTNSGAENSNASTNEVSDEAVSDKEPVGILSDDGKHVIPMTALKAERQARYAAEDEARKLRESVEALMSGNAAKPSEGEITPEQEEAILTDFPDLAPVIKGLHTARAQAESATRIAEELQNARLVEIRKAPQDVVDSIPTLANWQATDPAMWAEAVQADKILQSIPEVNALPLNERLLRAVAVVNAAHGITDTPRQENPAPPKKAPNPNPNYQPPQQPRQGKPKTLSDIPGGIPGSNDPIEQIISLKPEDMFARMSKMSDAERDALLERLG